MEAEGLVDPFIKNEGFCTCFTHAIDRGYNKGLFALSEDTTFSWRENPKKLERYVKTGFGVLAVEVETETLKEINQLPSL